MKQLSKLMTALVALVVLAAMQANAQQKWNFQSTPTNDVTNLSADANWTYDSGNDRYSYSKATSNEALKANGAELAMTQGLRFTAAASKLRVDVNRRLQFNGKGIAMTIPGLKKGQEVKVTCVATGNTATTLSATNLSDVSGLAEADKNTTQNGSGTVTQDGDVTLTSTSGGINILSVEVSESTAGPTPGPTSEGTIANSVQRNTAKNQVVITTLGGNTYYYNAEDIVSIDFDKQTGNTTVNTLAANMPDVFTASAADISLSKAADQGQPGVIENGGVEITEAKGWLESVYMKWKPLSGAESYSVYVRGGQYGSFTKIDQALVRNYGTYGRADVVGIPAGDGYELKIVPVIGGNEDEQQASTVSNLTVKAYSRQGFAFMNGYAPGAYNLDGTLKSNAKVFYVTSATAKTITTNVAGAANPCVGLQAIISGYEKGQDTTPIVFRIIGKVSASDLDAMGSSEEGIQIKGRRADSELNMTIEGIGDDATVQGFGFLVRNSKGVEFRNFAIMRCMDDGISMDTDNSNIWVHHMDVFYGKHGSGDHAKGDGAIDVKSDSKYVTVSYNRFWDTGKSNMFGMKSESGENWISYDHNWFDHSDSRHPRVRTMSVHVWNNFFDNVAKYGVGATSGSSVFVENNYFLKTKKPILSSKQGTDAQGSGTFSGENGGMIKAYGNYFDRTATNFRYYTQKAPASTGYDAYETDSRDEQVPATEKTVSGGTTYNNFDTNASKMYAYTPDQAEDVPAIVTGYYGAGRMNHGDITYTFTDNVGNDDTDSNPDSALESLIDNYKPTLVGIFGDPNQLGQGGEQGGGQGGEQGGGQEEEGTIVATFDGSPSNSMFTVGGSYGDGKVTYEGTYLKKGVKLDSKGSITFTPTKDYTMTLVLATAKAGRDVNVNGTRTTGGTENTAGAYFEIPGIAVTAGTEYTLLKGSGESIVMVVKLVPVEQ